MSFWNDPNYTAEPADEKPRPGRYAMLIIGLLVGAVVVGVAWLGVSLLGPEESGTQARGATSSPSQPPPSSATSTTDAPVADSPLSTCIQVYSGQQAPLQAAGPSMSQWEVHIGAMNKLVVGALTLKQATEFWNQTRMGAQARLDAFAAALRQFDNRTVRCPTAVGAQEPQELRSCSVAVAARGRTLHAARVALDIWRGHVRHMEMLRTGEMTPQRAVELWLRSWHQGQAAVERYRAAAHGANGLRC